MKILITISFLFISLFGIGQSNGKILEDAYEKNSSELLKQFFQNWNQEIQPISDSELSKLNDTLRETYSVFKGFYKPQSIDSLGGSEWGNDIYKNVKFLIVQNYIKIYFTDKLYYTDQEVDDYVVNYINSTVKEDSVRQKLLQRTDGKLSENLIKSFGPNRNLFGDYDNSMVDSIIDFRPSINCNGKSPLYLTADYNNMLNSFLGNKNIPIGTGGIMNPALSTGESEKRKKFLERYIKIWYGHWGGYWQLISYPKAFSVTFDKDMKYARVAFRMVYEGGEAILKNENGSWVLISSKRTWIE